MYLVDRDQSGQATNTWKTHTEFRGEDASCTARNKIQELCFD